MLLFEDECVGASTAPSAFAGCGCEMVSAVGSSAGATGPAKPGSPGPGSSSCRCRSDGIETAGPIVQRDRGGALLLQTPSAKPPSKRALGAGADGVRRRRGFTLIELMITLAVVAILASIALPSYTRYITRTRLRGGQTDLLALSLNMENYYQLKLTYPVATTTTAQTQAALTGWSPAFGTDFSYVILSSSATSYTLKATGISPTVSGYTLTMDNTSVRQQTAPGGSVTSW